jgi:hypothetical protein
MNYMFNQNHFFIMQINCAFFRCVRNEDVMILTHAQKANVIDALFVDEDT